MTPGLMGVVRHVVFYSLMKLGFISEDYRYSYRRIWVSEKAGKVVGILDVYPYKDQKIASHLLDEAEVVAAKQGYHILSLNVDQENPRAQRLYEHKGYQTEKTMTIGDRTYDHMIKRI